ncbi:MAG: hypothetical protein ACEY3M_10740 [Wolbachia sp.]
MAECHLSSLFCHSSSPLMSSQCVTLVFHLDSSIKCWNDMAECHPSSSLLSSQSGIQEYKNGE